MFKNVLELILDHGDDKFKIETTDEMLFKLLVDEKSNYIQNQMILYEIVTESYVVSAKKRSSFRYSYDELSKKHTELLKTNYKDVKYFPKNDSFLNKATLIHIFDNLLRNDYNPPNNHIEVLFHLRAFHLFYGFIVKIIGSISLNTMEILEYNLMQLIGEVNQQKGMLYTDGAKNLERLSSSKKGKASGKEERKRVVLNEFNQVKRKFPSVRSLCNHIQTNIQKKGIKAPTTKTIAAFLREEGKI